MLKIIFIKFSSDIIALFLAGTILMLLVSISACKKFVEIPQPDNTLTSGQVFADDAAAASAITGIYSGMMNSPSLPTSNLITLYAGLSADELYNYTTDARSEFVVNNITITNHGTINSSFWNPFYRFIYAANACIEGIDRSVSMSEAMKKRLKGEALFVRAFCHFYMVNLFGDVPLITTTDYTITATLPRTNSNEIYLRIIEDLKEASKLMGDYPTTERVRPSKWVALALLARVYLYTGQWQLAESTATEIMNSNSFSLLDNLDNVFLKGSNETIWQLRPVSPNQNTWEGNRILPASSTETPKYALTINLLNALTANDKRKMAWVGSRVFSGQTLYYPRKYKVVGNGAPLTEYYVVFRLAEIHLIRAEARAQQEMISESIADLNKIRLRAGLTAVATTPPLIKNDLLLLIEQERRLELFSEWGHRWFDLKRTSRADAVLSALKPATWQSTDVRWPVPVNQLTINPFLTQNEGY